MLDLQADLVNNVLWKQGRKLRIQDYLDELVHRLHIQAFGGRYRFPGDRWWFAFILDLSPVTGLDGDVD
jgi:hypothetical protein